MTLRRGLLTAVWLAAAAGPASAADWRYCLAASDADHKVYVSAPFFTSDDWLRAETAFRDLLKRSHLENYTVQCPRSDDESSLLAMQRHAINFNSQYGNRTTVLDWHP
ncbi:hypothetical protein HNR60_000544 [Rhodopseudomonas rhenobacensis]|uniref:Uncharacterized protein n=1 Tax=Rhodopseudomonas rhenobacensis TaxID=87461 RepID=A0A7W7Z0U3_9BRAD|nr:hypothetical protein [Rhodopseudomonas rhenobacensis]MBB5045809.1 hypothetical protein [Rhodopseudomonas rhenobacensis]